MTRQASSPGENRLQPGRIPRRIMAIWLASLAVDRWRHSEHCRRGEGEDAIPVALVSENAHGLRIEAVNDAALAAGVRAGTRLADARGICPQLRNVPFDATGDHAFLERMALWGRRWGPACAVDPPDGLLIDITGAAHLAGGEDALLHDAQGLFARQGMAARMAIAPTAGAAWALAHYGSSPVTRGSDDLAVELGRLPVAALRLDTDVLLVLRRLGLKRIGDLRKIGRDALQRRFRNRQAASASPLLRLDQLLGYAPEPLLPVVAVEQPMAERRLVEPILHRTLLDRVVADCAGDIARELESRRQGARRLELALWRVDGDVLLRPLEMAAATRDPAHIVRLFAGRLDDVDAGFGIELVRMQAVWVQDLSLDQDDFEADTMRQGTSLSVCIDRLTVRLGKRAVSHPIPYASHVPERGQRWIPPLAATPDIAPERTMARPLKLLDRAEPIAVIYATPDGFPKQFRWRGNLHEVARVEGPERIAPEWWSEAAGARLRDYYRIEDNAGRRYWIYRHGIVGDGRGGAPQWFLQGLFA